VYLDPTEGQGPSLIILLAVRRIALLTRSIVGLERVVVSPVRAVAVIAPFDMRTSASIAVAVSYRAANQRAYDKGARRKPETIVVAVTVSLVAIATLAVVPRIVAVPSEVVALPVVAFPEIPLPPLVAILHLDDIGGPGRVLGHKHGCRSRRDDAGCCERSHNSRAGNRGHFGHTINP
jgi:hypothetical protein